MEGATPDALPEAMLDRLTARQQQVAQGILRGWDNRMIAEHLGCALGTVKKHVSAIFERLGVESRTRVQVLAQAWRKG